MRIVCLLGRTASGKSSIELKIERLGYNRLVSYTTREPREGEKNGVDYNFVTKEQFMDIVNSELVVEWAEYNGNYYGSPKPIGSRNNVVVLEPIGYLAYKEMYGKQVIGVLVDTDVDITIERSKRRDNLDEAGIKNLEARIKVDNERFNGIINSVDLVVNGANTPEFNVASILNYIKVNNIN